MNRFLFLVLIILGFAVYAQSQVNSQRVIFTGSSTPTSCVPGKVYTTNGLNPAKAWVGTSAGTCTPIDPATAGDVIGPASSTDNAVARFDTTTGKLIQNSLVTIDDSGSVNIPTGQTYKINNVALAKGDVGLGNVDNTSDATKNAAAVALTNKTGFNGLAITANGTNTLNIAAGQTLTVTTGGTLGSAAYISSTAGGDLSGTLPSPTVAKINGATLGTTTATSGNVLIGSGSQWGTQAISGSGATITLANTGVLTISAIPSATLNLTPTTCTNQFVTAISSGGVGTCTTDTLAGAQHANQGTTTTVLHGNASGNPSFAQIVNADITNSTIDLTAKVTGVLPVANGGTNANSASITAFNNITGYTASGATGTTSTNLVFSASPTFTGTIVAAAGTYSGLVNVTGTNGVRLYGVGVPGDTNIEYIDQFHNGASGAVLSVTKAGSGSFRALALQTGGITTMSLGAASGIITLNTTTYNTCTALTTTAAVLGCTVSDERVKNGIKPFSGNALEMISKIQPITFQYNKGTPWYKGRTEMGFSAQNLKAANPMLASETGNVSGSLLQPEQLSIQALAIAGINELRARVKRLEKENARLRRK